MAREDLSQYVSRILRQRQMTVRDVEERSGGEISNGYVSDITSGRQKNPSADKLLALAKGLDVDVHELLDAATSHKGTQSYSQVEDIDPMALLELMRKVIASPYLMELLQEASMLKPKELEMVLKTLRLFNEADDRPFNRKRAG